MKLKIVAKPKIEQSGKFAESRGFHSDYKGYSLQGLNVPDNNSISTAITREGTG